MGLGVGLGWVQCGRMGVYGYGQHPEKSSHGVAGLPENRAVPVAALHIYGGMAGMIKGALSDVRIFVNSSDFIVITRPIANSMTSPIDN